MQHTDVDSAETFYLIEKTLRDQSTLTQEGFDPQLGKFSTTDYRVMSDDNVFWPLVYVPFYSGMRSSTVTQRLPTIKKYLHDFRKVKDYSGSEVDQMMSDPNMICHGQKIESCIYNAREFVGLLEEYGTLHGGEHHETPD